MGRLASSEGLDFSSIRLSSAFGQMGTRLSCWPCGQSSHFLDRLDEAFPAGLMFKLLLKLEATLLLTLTKLYDTLLFMMWKTFNRIGRKPKFTV